MRYWLIKSEPHAFSFDDLKAVKSEPWDGVRNYQARNFMRDDMRKGDWVLFYHSSCKEPGVVGLAKVVREGYPDSTAMDSKSKYFDAKSSFENPRWYMVDIAWESEFPQMVPLSSIKENPKLAEMRLVQKGNRLSIMPLEPQEFAVICDMGGLAVPLG